MKSAMTARDIDQLVAAIKEIKDLNIETPPPELAKAEKELLPNLQVNPTFDFGLPG